jgi:transcriptional regulator with XRE-family HTH domain
MANFFKERRDFLTKREGKTISQNYIARRLDVTSNYVGQWEREVMAPNLRLATKLAEIYDVPIERMEQEIVLLTRKISSRVVAAH